MMLCRWEKLPIELRKEEIRPYFEKLRKKRTRGCLTSLSLS